MTEPTAEGLGIGEHGLAPEAVAAVAECMTTQRAIRRFSTAPVDRAVLEFVLASATRAGSGGNSQPWRFVVVTDAEARRALGDWYRLGWAEYGRRGMSDLPEGASPTRRRAVESAAHLAAHIQDAPVVVVASMLIPRGYHLDFFAGASVFPAVQNLLLAARAVGLGATLTTMQALSGVDEQGRSVHEPVFLDGLRELLGMPQDAVPAAVVPMGWPEEPYGPTSRKPLEKVVYVDRWGAPWT